jgi:hypothetical protein
MQFNASALNARLHDFGLAKVVEAGATAYYSMTDYSIWNSENRE